MKLKPGTRYLLTLKNTALITSANVTNVHTHGLHVSSVGNGDNAARYASSGSCLQYNYTLSPDLAGGTFWYHAHSMGTTNTQVLGGALGMIIVEDIDPKTSTIPAIPSNLTQPIQDNLAAFLNNGFSVMCLLVGSSAYCNGGKDAVGTRFQLQNGNWYRLRIGVSNPAGTATALSLASTTGCDIRTVARDGILVASIPTAAATSWFIGPFGRLDLAVKCSASNSLTWGTGKIYLDVVNNLTASTASPFAGGTTTWAPVRPPYLADMATATIPTSNKISIAMSATSIKVNGASYGATQVAATLQANQIYELTFGSTNGHPYHVHTSHMLIMSGCGTSYKVGDFYDTVTTGSGCVVRLRAPQYNGRLMMHCHVLAHEDGDAMTNFLVVNGTDTATTDPPLAAFSTCPV